MTPRKGNLRTNFATPIKETAVWVDTASRIESVAERKEFINGVLGYHGPWGFGTAVLAGVLGWSLLRGRRP